MKIYIRLLIILLNFSFLLASCTLLPEEDGDKDVTSDALQAPVEVEPDAIAESELLISTLLGHDTGNFELRITMELEEQQGCRALYPFSIRTEGDRILLTGDSDVVLDCHFTWVSCNDSCMTKNVTFDFNTRIDGEVLLDSSDPTDQSLELYYFYDGMLIEYYSDYPEEASVSYTGENPLELLFGDLTPAAMQFEEGAVVILIGEEGSLVSDDLPVQLEHALWTLTLHLQ